MLGLEISVFGHLAVAAVRGLLRLERAGGAVAGKQAALIETWLWWALLAYTRELEVLSEGSKPRGPQEARALSETACLLSILFALTRLVRAIHQRCAARIAPLYPAFAAAPPPMPVPADPFPRPPAHARAAWYTKALGAET